jgi:hypothetical protein
MGLGGFTLKKNHALGKLVYKLKGPNQNVQTCKAKY